MQYTAAILDLQARKARYSSLFREDDHPRDEASGEFVEKETAGNGKSTSSTSSKPKKPSKKPAGNQDQLFSTSDQPGLFGKQPKRVGTLDTKPAVPSPKFIPHRDQGDGETSVAVDVDQLDHAWRKGLAELYLKPGAEASKGRRVLVEQFFETGKPIEMPRVIVKPNGQVEFRDGRHRFSVLRDRGLKQMPVAIDKSDLPLAQQFLGASTEKTESPLDDFIFRQPDPLPDQKTFEVTPDDVDAFRGLLGDVGKLTLVPMQSATPQPRGKPLPGWGSEPKALFEARFQKAYYQITGPHTHSGFHKASHGGGIGGHDDDIEKKIAAMRQLVRQATGSGSGLAKAFRGLMGAIGGRSSSRSPGRSAGKSADPVIAAANRDAAESRALAARFRAHSAALGTEAARARAERAKQGPPARASKASPAKTAAGKQPAAAPQPAASKQSASMSPELAQEARDVLAAMGHRRDEIDEFMSKTEKSGKKFGDLQDVLAHAYKAPAKAVERTAPDGQFRPHEKPQGKPAAKKGDGEGHWVTLENGTHVKLDGDGHITAGPKALQGKDVDNLPRSKPLPGWKEHRSKEKAKRLEPISKPAVGEKPDLPTFHHPHKPDSDARHLAGEKAKGHAELAEAHKAIAEKAGESEKHKAHAEKLKADLESLEKAHKATTAELQQHRAEAEKRAKAEKAESNRRVKAEEFTLYKVADEHDLKPRELRDAVDQEISKDIEHWTSLKEAVGKHGQLAPGERKKLQEGDSESLRKKRFDELEKSLGEGGELAHSGLDFDEVMNAIKNGMPPKPSAGNEDYVRKVAQGIGRRGEADDSDLKPAATSSEWDNVPFSMPGRKSRYQSDRSFQILRRALQ